MPPWLPAPGFGDFAGERRLTDAQIETIEQWVRAGAPEGSPSDSPPLPVFTPGWQLGAPDLVVTADKPFSVPADGPDVFWNFILSPAVRETRQVKAIEIRPGNARTVHHANLLIDRSRSMRYRENARGAGFAGMDLEIASDTFDPDSHFLFWKPGATPWEEPAGMSWRLDPGNDLILNVHLRPTGKPELVQPSVGLYFTREPQTKYPMLLQLEHDGALDIPPGDRDFPVSDDFRLPLDVDLLAVYPHAHYLGKLLEGYATLPDGTRRWLIRIPDWDLNWQAVYRYREPLFLPKGTVISMRYHYDNSAANPRNPNSPPKRVVGGNQSTDEMAHLWLQVLPRGSGDQRVTLTGGDHASPPGEISGRFFGALQSRRALPQPQGHSVSHRPSGRRSPRRAGAAGRAEYLRRRARIGWQARRGHRRSSATSFACGLTTRAPATIWPTPWPRRAGSRTPPPASANCLPATRKIVAAHEHLVEILQELGDSAASAGRLQPAAECYRELVALEPGNPDLRNNYGILLARSGDLVSALAQFEAALKLDPAHASARRNLELTRQKMRH